MMDSTGACTVDLASLQGAQILRPVIESQGDRCGHHPQDRERRSATGPCPKWASRPRDSPKGRAAQPGQSKERGSRQSTRRSPGCVEGPVDPSRPHRVGARAGGGCCLRFRPALGHRPTQIVRSRGHRPRQSRPRSGLLRHRAHPRPRSGSPSLSLPCRRAFGCRSSRLGHRCSCR